MDWKDEIDANLWAFPRGMQRDGNVGSNSIKWTSKYGSVITSAGILPLQMGLMKRTCCKCIMVSRKPISKV